MEATDQYISTIGIEYELPFTVDMLKAEWLGNLAQAEERLLRAVNYTNISMETNDDIEFLLSIVEIKAGMED